MPESEMLAKYDRQRGRLKDVADWTKPSTIQTVEFMTGRAETYIVATARYEDGDYLFVESVDMDGVVRLCLSPKVCSIIHSQRDSLTAKRRSKAAKRSAQERMSQPGYVPPFLKSKRGKKAKKP